MTTIPFEDTLALADLQRYATLARAIDPDAAMRLVASGGVLAAYVCVVPGRGITGGGTVLGLRTFAVEPGEDASGNGDGLTVAADLRPRTGGSGAADQYRSDQRRQQKCRAQGAVPPRTRAPSAVHPSHVPMSPQLTRRRPGPGMASAVC